MMLFRTARRAGAVAACCLLMLLGACGPGVTGTGSGTGDDGNSDIRYEPLSICTAPFAEVALACDPLQDPADLDFGTAPVQWSDANKDNEGAVVLVAIDAQTLTLRLACGDVRFEGRWGRLPDDTLAFVGRYRGTSAPDGRPAITRLTAAPGEPDAVGWLQVDDDSGSTLFGPWLVRRVEGEVAFVTCLPV
jgi:hypothetical protein